MRTLMNLEARLRGELLCMSGCVLLSVLGVSCGVSKAPIGGVVAVPHTAKAFPQGRSLLVSPDEQWISIFERESNAGAPLGLSSVELATGRYVRHDVDDIDAEYVSSGRPPAMGVFSLFHGDSKYVGWCGDKLYLSFGEGRAALILDNKEPSASRGRAPSEPLQVSDGWVHQYLQRAIAKAAVARNDWTGDASEYSLAWRDGRYSEALYWYDHRTRGVYASGPDGRVRRITKIKGTFFKSVMEKEIRVSPDERFLAYATVAHLKAPFPTPYMRMVVTVRELGTHRAIEVGGYRNISTLTWGRDGRHLYFIGGGGIDSVAVRIADMGRLFDK